MYSIVMSEPRSGSDPGAFSGEDPAELLRRVAEDRDKNALAILFGHFAPRIKSMMLKLGAGDALAEDLAQETLLIVWRKAHILHCYLALLPFNLG